MDVLLFGFAVLSVFLFFIFLLVFQWWVSRRPPAFSPYSRFPLRRGHDISYEAKICVLRYLFELHQYDNKIFDFQRAAVCRETGRIFQDCITWYGAIDLDWSFLKKRMQGQYVSWGSLTDAQQLAVYACHDTLAGFQVEMSSSQILPKHIEAIYAFTKPGPLYVDINTFILLGWKCVPGTELEVLIVQKPKERMCG